MPYNVLGPGHELSQRLKGIERAAFTGGDLQPYMEAPSGMYLPGAWMNVPPGPVASGPGAAAHVAEWYPFYVPVTVAVQTVSINVTTAQTGWTGIRLGFYNGSLADFTLVQDFGVFPVDTTGVKTLTGQWTIPKGWMWVAAKLEGSGTTAPSLSRATGWVPPTPILGSTTNQVGSPVYGHISKDLSGNYSGPSPLDGPFPPTLEPVGPMSWAPLQVGIQVL